MNKELFIKAIDAIENQVRYDISVSKKISEVYPDAFQANLIYNNSSIVNALIEVLQDAMKDDIVVSWIEYYCFELDFGKENYRLKVYDKDKNEIPLATAEDLYNILTISESE